ncbi:hypothetical protein CONLIGDRAFT_188560 [Coniochaeta ligniaria NRRL 30616]|uniref:Spp2/MOS2 G-patch domain-containing protein n=1 Tax=Coniochaeta ligniaria NRRL 30616 TaxID=1408157 RepID=A0A1J7J1P9_9PEZI|nr:hypothetical protein CONLIGDRAFT_188560 [Coniochaeta ligniaria NRRL 30616]
MSDRDGPPPRIAIKLGSSSLNGGAKKHARPTPPSTLGKRHRAQALNGEGSGSEDDEEAAGVTHEAITAYGPDGASAEDRRQRRRTRSRSRDRDSKSRRKGNRHGERRGDESLKETDPADKDKNVQWGLTINKKPRREDGERTRRAGSEGSVDVKTENERGPKTADEEAMDALLGNSEDKKRVAMSDGDVDRDPVPEDYEKVPIDDFGAHLLKNFGWNGQMIGKVKEVRKHANLTGLGAKGKGAEDLGAWSQKPAKDGGSNHDKPRRPRLDEYRREEEKKKQRREERHRDSDRHRDSRESSHRRDREGDRDRSRDRHRDRDRDRDRR